MKSNDLLAQLVTASRHILETREANVKAMAEIDRISAKPKIATVHATSRQTQRTRYVASTSMNDILESAKADGLWNDPLYKKAFQEMNSILNRS